MEHKIVDFKRKICILVFAQNLMKSLFSLELEVCMLQLLQEDINLYQSSIYIKDYLHTKYQFIFVTVSHEID